MMESSRCKSDPVKAVAGRPVASVAIHRATGGCEAYTVRKRAVRIQLRNRPLLRVPTWFAQRKAAVRRPLARGRRAPPESLARGTLPQGLPVNPGELPHLFLDRGVAHPTRRSQLGPYARSERMRKPVDRGKPEVGREVVEQSYEPIVPMKVGNRRAPAARRGGHGTHWREGGNRPMYRREET